MYQLPNEGIVWHRNKENGLYRKMTAAIIRDTVLVLKPISLTTKIFSSGMMEIDVRSSLVQIVPAPPPPPPAAAVGTSTGTAAPAPRVFSRNKERQCYFRVVHKGKTIELKARDNFERDRWVQLLLGIKDRKQTHDETYPFGVPPRDADEHIVHKVPQRGGGPADEEPPPVPAQSTGADVAPIGVVDGVDVVASDTEGGDDDDENDSQTGGQRRTARRSSGSGRSEDRPLSPVTPTSEPDSYTQRHMVPTSNVNVAPKILVDPPSDTSTPQLSPRSARRAKASRHRLDGTISSAGDTVSFEEGADDGSERSSSTRSSENAPRRFALDSIRPETRGFLARLHEMAAYGTLRMPSKSQQFMDSVFATSVLEDSAEMPGGLISVVGGGSGGRTLQVLVAAAARDGVLVQLVSMASDASNSSATASPSASLRAKRRSNIATSSFYRRVNSGSNLNSSQTLPLMLDEGEEAHEEARLSVDRDAAIVTTTALETVLRIPFAAIESLTPRFESRHAQRTRLYQQQQQQQHEEKAASSGTASVSTLPPQQAELDATLVPTPSDSMDASTDEGHSGGGGGSGSSRPLSFRNSSFDVFHGSIPAPTVAVAAAAAAAVPAAVPHQVFRLEVFYWSDIDGAATMLFPDRRSLQRVVLAFASALDLRVCTRLLVERHEDAMKEPFTGAAQLQHRAGAQRSLLLKRPHLERFFAGEDEEAVKAAPRALRVGLAAPMGFDRVRDKRRVAQAVAADRCEHEQLLDHVRLDVACHEAVQHFIVASKGFY